jgi:hypothetical protein
LACDLKNPDPNNEAKSNSEPVTYAPTKRLMSDGKSIAVKREKHEGCAMPLMKIFLNGLDGIFFLFFLR